MFVWITHFSIQLSSKCGYNSCANVILFIWLKVYQVKYLFQIFNFHVYRFIMPVVFIDTKQIFSTEKLLLPISNAVSLHLNKY